MITNVPKRSYPPPARSRSFGIQDKRGRSGQWNPRTSTPHYYRASMLLIRTSVLQMKWRQQEGLDNHNTPALKGWVTLANIGGSEDEFFADLEIKAWVDDHWASKNRRIKRLGSPR